jgi:hypothetical protein
MGVSTACHLAQRFEERHQVIALGRGEAQRLQDPLAVGVLSLLVEVRVVAHDVVERRVASVVLVGRGARDVSVAWLLGERRLSLGSEGTVTGAKGGSSGAAGC